MKDYYLVEKNTSAAKMDSGQIKDAGIIIVKK